MASNRDPQKDYRLKPRSVTSSFTRSKRVKKASAPRPTSSSTRARGKNTGSQRVTSSDQRPRGTGAPVTGSKPKTKPKSITMGGDTGRRGGTNQPARKPGPPTPGRGSVNRVGKELRAPKPSSGGGGRGGRGGPNLRATATAALAGALAVGSLRNPVTKAKEKELRQKEREAGKNRPMPDMGKNYKGKEQELARQATISSFDRAFAAARKAGKKEFTWRGKRYNTKLK